MIMVFLRRFRRIELIMLASILAVLIMNLVYFKKLEVKLESDKYSSKFSMGASDGNYDYGKNKLAFESMKKEEYMKKLSPSTVDFPGGDESEHKQIIESDRNRLLKNDFEDFADDDYKDTILPPLTQAEVDMFLTTTPVPFIKPKPLKPLKIKQIEPNDEFKKEIVKIVSDIDMCPKTPPNLRGTIEPDTNIDTIKSVEETLSEVVYSGGFYTPLKCQARHRVAIIVPYRNRPDELAIFLKNIHPFLQKQQLEYGIFIVEQTVGTKFNRGMLLNVGFLEAKKIKKFDCFIFHDVDLLPLDDRILYKCSENPRHLAVGIDRFDNKLASYNTLSGALAVTAEQFEKMNGYSNLFWGWGCEDLDLANRLKNAGYIIERYDAEVALYKMLGNAKFEPNPKRFELLNNGHTKFKTSGLNSIKYTVQCIDETPTYMWIFVTLKAEVPGDDSNVEQLGVKI